MGQFHLTCPTYQGKKYRMSERVHYVCRIFRKKGIRKKDNLVFCCGNVQVQKTEKILNNYCKSTTEKVWD
jgi:hypothetical protein